MGLFFEVLSAINNPNQRASIDQLGTITNTVQQLASSRGIEPSQMQTLMSALGGVLRPAIQQQRTAIGGNQLEGLIGQLAGGSLSSSVIQSMLPPQMQQQIIQGISQRTGMDASMLQAILPSLIPVVLNLINMGGSKTGSQGSNPILNTFLDGDRDGDTDLGDVFKFAGRFLNPPNQLPQPV